MYDNTFFHKLRVCQHARYLCQHATLSFSCSQWYLYSSVRKFVIEGTDLNGENWYKTNNNQFTVFGFVAAGFSHVSKTHV